MLCGLQGVLGACPWWTFEEPPLEHLVSANHGLDFSSGLFLVWSLHTFILACGTGSVVSIIVSIFLACYALTLRCKRVSPIIRQVSSSLGLCLMTAGFYHHIATNDALSAVYVFRSTGMVCMAWRSFLPFAVHQLNACVVCSAVNTIMECIMMHQILARFGNAADEFNRVVTTQVCMSVVGLVWCSYLAMLRRSMWEVQQQLTFEKGACESLLSMICDGIAWVDADGDIPPAYTWFQIPTRGQLKSSLKSSFNLGSFCWTLSRIWNQVSAVVLLILNDFWSIFDDYFWTIFLWFNIFAVFVFTGFLSHLCWCLVISEALLMVFSDLLMIYNHF